MALWGARHQVGPVVAQETRLPLDNPRDPGVPEGPWARRTWDVPVIMFLMKSRWPGASMMVM